MKKTLSLVLTILMLASVFTLLVSCGNTDNPADTTKSIANTTTAAAAETKDPDDISDLPSNLNFGGETINVLSCDRDWWIDEVSVESENGSIVNDAVYRRNQRVEAQLNIKINNILIDYGGSNASALNAVEKDIKGGNMEYDVAFINCYKACGAIPDGYFKDLKTVKYIDLEKNYWLESLNESIGYHGHQYVASGDISLSHIRMAFATLFNKKLFDSAHVPYLYEAVEKNTWTIEYQIQLLDTFYNDKDGSMTKTADDIYGLIASAKIMSDPYWEAFELPIVNKNSDGDYQFAIEQEKYSNVVDTLIRLFAANGTNKYPHETADAELGTMSKAFAEGKGAMMTTILVECEREWMRNMTDQYGVVPMPKFTEDQEDYHTHLFDQYTVVTILSNVLDTKLEMSGAFLEAMAYQSSLDTIPAYFETTLKMQYSSDPTSWKMLDEVMDNVVVDAGNIYFSVLGQPHAKLGIIVDSGNNTVSSSMRTFKKATEANVDKLNTLLKDLDK